MNFVKKLIMVIALGSYGILCNAELTIEINEGSVVDGIPVAVVPFAASAAPIDIAGVINADLARSGYFKMMQQGSMPSHPSSASQVQFGQWQGLGQNFLVVGQVNGNGSQYNVQFQLLDVQNSNQMLGYQMGSSAADLRRTAHHIADLIFEKLTGKKGVFSGRIAYITSDSNRSMLQVSDTDGYNPQTITTSTEPLMSPSWSPDKRKIAYVSFEKHNAAIYVQTLATGQRERVAEFRGINGAPAWSPDSSKLALTLSKDGSPDIYTLDLATKSVRRLTKNNAIDTEPSWSPDGSKIVFTSDRGGKPQLYLVPTDGGEEERITYTGDYNARGSFSPDGQNIVMVHGNGGDYRIAVMDVNSKTISPLTTGPSDESPSFAPNGSMILYASKKGRTGFLSSVTLDGKMQQRMVFNSGEVREPAWAP